jgi:hypothetical protein
VDLDRGYELGVARDCADAPRRVDVRPLDHRTAEVAMRSHLALIAVNLSPEVSGVCTMIRRVDRCILPKHSHRRRS